MNAGSRYLGNAIASTLRCSVLVLASLACLPALAGPSSVASAEVSPDKKPWSIEEMHGPSFPFSVTLDEATWISVDVSPDGQRIVFDVLGDLFTLPVGGGVAKRITQGPAYDVQPRYSPDGKRIAFLSDRNGKSDIWVVDADGANPKQITDGKDVSFCSPAWMPDGHGLVVSRHDDRLESDGYDLFLYSAATGTGVKLVGMDRDALGGVPSPDGEQIYFNRTKGAAFPTIEAFDRKLGKSSLVVSGEGGAVRPALSPDGRWLAFGRRYQGQERLFVRDLAKNLDRMLDVQLDLDQQGNTQRDGDELPGYAFLPDSSAIIYGAHGKIRRCSLATGESVVIPFQLKFEQTIQRTLRQKLSVDDGPVHPKLLRWTHASPDGKTLFFSMGGKDYRYDIAKRSVGAIGDVSSLQYSPAVSPDGRSLAFVTWSDSEGGQIYETEVNHDSPVCLTQKAGHYEHLAWSPDGSKLVFLRSSGGEFKGEGNLEELAEKDICWIEAGHQGPAHRIASVKPRGDRREEMRPTFDRTGERIFFTETPVKRQATYLWSMKLDGTDRRKLLKFKFADDVMPSPDEKWVAFTEQFEVYLTPFPAAGEGTRDVDINDPKGVTKLSSEGGYFVNWAQQGSAITWGWGPSFYSVKLADAIAKPYRSAPDKLTIDFTVPRPIGQGEVLLQGARIITMGPLGVIEKGDLLVRNGRIESVGESGRVAHAVSAKVVDVSGKTIMPGLVDGHSHYREGRNPELYPENDWGFVIQLAYGVTTIRDPSARSQSIFSQAEMIEMGRTLGPRVYSTGEPIYFASTAFARPIKDLEDARLQVRRLKALGATTIKQYILPRREQRQWLLEAAREEGLMAVPEGAGKTYYDITHLMDGFTTLEHSIKVDTLYADIRSLIVSTQIYCTPTLIVGYNGAGEDYFYDHSDVLKDSKLLRFTPYPYVAPFALKHSSRPESDYFFMYLAKNSAAILHDGGKVLLGAHGNRLGLGTHWEIWAMAMGGLTPMEALRTATIIPAGALGLADEIGSLEHGKVADLIVLDANPLDNIRNTNTVRFVMKAGRMWDGDTMDQVLPTHVPFGGFYWRKLKTSQ